MVKKTLDGVDLKILRILQDEGRISNLDLSKKISMSPPPTLRRVRDLENNGYIDGFRANLDPTKLGYDFILFHELGHEWWGNFLSVADWSDFWIHEGICT